MHIKTTLLTLLVFFPCLVLADNGPKPSLDLIITENGKQITTPALVCYDAFFLSSIYRSTPTTDPEIKAFISPGSTDNPHGGCQICQEGSCGTWFYGFPDSILIQYPVEISGNGSDVRKIAQTKTYQTSSLKTPAGLQNYATADLRPDSMIQVSFQKTTKTLAYYLK